MKKFHLIYAAFIIGNAIFWSGCSKNDNDSPDPDPKQEITMPKEAFQLQIVEAQFSQPLLQEEYDADLGGIPLKLVRSNDNTLVFYVPGTTAVGETTLNIPQLEAQSKFEVKKSVLNGNEEVILKPFFEDLNFSQNRISDEEYSEYLADALTAFEAYYKSLSKDDKNQMALFYQVNENWFKKILGLNSTPKFTTLGAASTFKSVKNYQLTVLTFVTSGLIVVYGATPLEKSVAAVACLASGAFAWQYQKELVGEIKIVDKIVDKIIDPVFGNQITKSTLGTQGLVFTNDEAQNVNLYTGNRSVTTADELSTAEGTSIYFDAYGRLINITEKVNGVIQFINDNLFFSNISQIPVHKIPDSAEMQSGVLTAEDYNSLKFTVADANVQLSDVAFENGVVRMKMTVKNPDAVTGNSVKTTLNYTYQNEFSNANGSIAIEIFIENNPCDNSNTIPPIITNTEIVCNSYGGISILISFTADGTGALISSDSGACDQADMCYPVRLYFLSPGASEYSIAANGYSAKLKSGSVNAGVIEIIISTPYCLPEKTAAQSLEQFYPNYQWKLELMNGCNQRSNQVSL
ncbi:hypothetical protein [Myroides indicus]|uniref:Uncharacterized protein n=1 Tax=Myroides indicus TaxID=1323422 RepID=A0A4R7F4F0_9FLAO|nr:hypothetical protein [Myroides indicus]TDS58173.1 hypothetical protein C8P70_1124 [Myroides indicus]